MTDKCQIAALSPGIGLSHVVAGMWRVMRWNMTRETLAAFIEECVALGVTSFDHADIYGGYEAESFFGDALALRPGLRSRIQLITKAGIKLVSAARPTHRVKHYDSSAAHLRESVERSLRALRSERIELFLLHRPDPLMDADELALEIERLLREGKIGAFGVSNFTARDFDALHARMPLATNQIELSPFMPTPLEDGTLSALQTARVTPMIWSPLGGGRLFDERDPVAARVRETLQAIQRERGVTSWVSIAYAWIFRLPSRPIAIAGTQRIDGMRDAVNALDIELTREEWYAVRAAAQGREVS
ncbi:aldo/keto reductase [Caballeronia temeraria]|uniref:Aldo/keto reductase n=1 Tax=Caballeronia temeraria TaxID=1777137 RepID=A0A158DT25_9BURK|nr:aldo/keto reductase [Caballeronia temeraria]SAK97809.1 aldo/keto reductase [Caballeronia temeraria]